MESNNRFLTVPLPDYLTKKRSLRSNENEVEIFLLIIAQNLTYVF